MRFINSSIEINTDGYGIYYPSDDSLDPGFLTVGDAKEYRSHLLDIYPDSYVVRVQVTRV